MLQKIRSVSNLGSYKKVALIKFEKIRFCVIFAVCHKKPTTQEQKKSKFWVSNVCIERSHSVTSPVVCRPQHKQVIQAEEGILL